MTILDASNGGTQNKGHLLLPPLSLGVADIDSIAVGTQMNKSGRKGPHVAHTQGLAGDPQ